MTKKTPIHRKLISVLLCLALLMSFLPSFATAIDVEAVKDRVADDPTWNGWESLFGPKHPSTENAGAVWTDKSVFTADNLPLEFTNAGGKLADTGDNFLVALSAIASNKEIVGYSTIPTDTVLVLDLSGSMADDGRDVAMVRAANQAIDDLLKLNYNNRVGVVLYNGSNTGDGYSTPSEGSVVFLPLDRYTTTSTYTYREGGRNVTIPGYISYTAGQGNRSATIGVYSGVRNSNNNNVTGSKAVSGATYIQSGLYRALEMFKGVAKSDTVIEDGVIQGGTKRMPITVLMSDGAPTVATTNYTNVHVGNSNVGNGNNSCATDEVGFLTQLTAAYVKSEIEAHYETDSLFYSLGVGVGNDAVAKAVLDPKNANDGSQNYWARYFNLSNNTALNLSVPRSGTPSNYYNTRNVAIYRNAVITEENYLYTDKYFGANDAAGLVLGFEDIVNEIYIQSRYYPTSLEGGNPDFSGYITYTDQIGEYMEVKGISGILLNGHLYTGEMMASKIGTELGSIENPTELGREFLNAVKTRLGIADNTEVYRLVNNAWNDKQLYFKDNGNGNVEFSNYIGWYAYADGSYAGYYNEGTTTVPEGLDTNGDGIIDKKVVYANKSYGLLGEASGSIKDSDMMYMSIQVHTNIETGEQSLIWKIPAALVPMVTYKVSVEGNVIHDDTNVLDVEIAEATPVRLLYEVGLHSSINELNVGQIVEEKHVDKDGNRVFWSNYFDVSSQNHDDHVVTYAEFTPNEDNERYYYVDIAPIYDADGADTPITTAPVAGNTYYTERYTYSTTSDKPISYYEEIAATDLDEAVYNSTLNCYVIPGHVYSHPKTEELHKNKSENKTDSAWLYYYPAIVATNASYVVSTHHGNNGKLTVVPATGIAISKTLEEIEVGAADTFKFKVTLTAPQGVSLASEYAYTLAAIGETTGEEGKVKVNNGVIEFDLKADQTVFITGLPAGAAYTVEEISDNDDYMVKNVHVNGVMQATAIAAGVITQYTLEDIDFLNAPTSEGELIIRKQVNHPFAADPAVLANKLFTVKIKLSGGDVANKRYTVTNSLGESSVTTNTDGEFTVSLGANEAVSIKGILAETDYIITEPDVTMPSGFVLDRGASSNLTGSIPADSNIVATVVNNYSYAPVTTDVDVVINKELSGRDWLDTDAFEFEVFRYDSGARAAETRLYGVTLTKNKKTDTYALNETYTTEGVYYYLVREKAGADNIGLTYDTDVREFRVYVTDTNMDGQLEVSKVENVLRTTVSGDAQNGFVVTVNDFNNSYAATGGATVTIDITKKVTGGRFPLNGFKFGLYTYVRDQYGNLTDELVLDTESSLTDAQGKATLMCAFTAKSVGKTYKYIIKEIDTGISGMTYDTTAYEVTIEVVDDLDGTISTNVSYAKIVSDTQKTPVTDIEFTNTYTPTNGELVISGNKVLENRVQYANEFKFELYETDSSYDITGKTPIREAYNAFDGGFAFDLLTYTAEDTYYYVVKEADTGVAGVTYDTTVYKLKVEVKQQGSAYVSEIVEMVGGNSSDIVFTNTYTAKSTEVTLSGNKVLAGRDLNDGEFEFAIFETADDFVAGNTADATVKNVGNRFTFRAIEYTSAGTYYYVIKEVDNGLGGIIYDGREFRVTVVITDNGRGQLIPTVTMTENGQSVTAITFRNSYSTKPTTIDIDGKKTLNGRDMKAGEFEFKLINAVNNNTVATTYNNADGSFKFGDIVITSAGTHHGKIVETVTGINGVTFDTTVYGFVVEIEDDLNGNLVETERRIWVNGQSVNDPYAPITFTNTYKATNEVVSLGGTKTLDGRALNDGEFKFSLYKTDSTYNIDGVTPTETVKNGADGKFKFSDILIASDTDLYYVIVEDATDALGGVTYDENVYKVKIDITDNLDGRYIIDTTVTQGNNNVGTDGIVFNNSYKADDTSVTFDGTKTLNGRTLKDGEFKFNLYKTDSTYSIDGVTPIETVKNGADGKFGFKAIDITSDEDLYFVIVEDATDKLDNVKYDENVYKIKVDVTDLLDGTYKVDTVILSGNDEVEDMTFVNVFTPADVTVDINVQKVLENKSDREMGLDGFDFALTGEDGTVNAKTDANGKAGFKLTFTANDIGKTFTYKLSEVKGNVKGMIYSEEVVDIKLYVTVNADGVIEVIYNDGTAPVTAVETEFTNIYEGDPDIPVTGDTSKPCLWFAFLLVGSVALVATVLYGKRSEKTEE